MINDRPKYEKFLMTILVGICITILSTGLDYLQAYLHGMQDDVSLGLTGAALFALRFI